jgi:hypothetical protein
MDRLPNATKLELRTVGGLSQPVADTEGINRTLDQVKLLVARLDERFNEIGTIAGTIAGLAKHSNLLALNAAMRPVAGLLWSRMKSAVCPSELLLQPSRFQQWWSPSGRRVTKRWPESSRPSVTRLWIPLP